VKLKRLVFTGLEQTASLWTPLAVAYDWVHQVAMLLDNETGQDAHTVQQSLSQLLNEMEHQKARVGNWQMELNTFSKSLVVIGQGYSIVMRSRVYLEQTMLSSMSLVNCVTINVASQVARLPQPHWFYAGSSDSSQ
jgi:hypothetical protein